MSAQDKTEQVVGTLLDQIARGRIRSDLALPVIMGLVQKSEPKGAASVEGLVALLGEDSRDPETRRLVEHLREVRVSQALEQHRGNANARDWEFYGGDSLPSLAPAWHQSDEVQKLLRPSYQLISDWLFIRAQAVKCPRIAEEVETLARASIAELKEKLACHQDILSGELSGPALEGDPGSAGDHFRRELESDAASRREATDAFATGSPEAEPEQKEEQRAVEWLRKRFEEEPSRAGKQRLLDLACGWSSCWIVPTLLEMCRDSWARERTRLLLTLRFGGSAPVPWDQWERWLRNQRWTFDQLRKELKRVANSHPLETLAIRFAGDPRLGEMLDEAGAGSSRVTAEDFVNRWSGELDREEWNALIGYEKPTPPPLPPEVLQEDPVAEPPLVMDEPEVPSTAQAEEPAEPLKPVPDSVVRPSAPVPEAPAHQTPLPPLKPRQPTIWEQHLRPFFVENWYFVAGIMMVILGSSLLAYYTWDKHWMWRYTIMPGLLALFTAAFAGAARWIESRGDEFRGTAATLRGTAIALLPVNFMTMALVSNDPQVTQKVLVLSCMGLIYLVLAGWGLRRWCSAAHPKLGLPLGGTLLLLNFLAGLAPLARALGGLDGQPLLLVLGSGFHLGFVVMTGAVVYFGRHVLTAEMAKDNRVPWFFGLTLGVTFVQVFAWVHGYLNHLPQVSTYAPMMILAAGLVLYTERRALQLLEHESDHRAESFFGYALILLGVVMGASHEYIRILCFALASAVWIYQASPRRQAAHFWIGLTLLVLAGASVGLLEWFPKQWLAGIGVTIGVLMGAVDLATRQRNPRLAEACRGIQLSVFLLTVLVAVLTQWHFRSEPLATGICLLALVGVFFWNAIRNDELRWMDAAMVILALALPYLGAVDMKGRTLHGNSMVFALGCLSGLLLLVTWRFRSVRVLLESRSTVIWIYGTLAVIGMFLRVFVERGIPIEQGGLRYFMDQAGPFLMAVSLILVAYFSRSLVPALMASVIAVILFPELKASLQPYMPPGFWGSGLGSAVTALAMTLTCLLLREWPALQKLENGDRFLGRHVFPLRRTDSTLFTVPLLLSSLFLLVKLVLLVFNQATSPTGWDGILLHSGFALLIAGLAWLAATIYFRARPESVIGVHLGWVMLLAGFGVVHLNLVEEGGRHWTWPVLFTLLALQLLQLAARALRRRWSWLEDALETPVTQILQVAAVGLALAFCAAASMDVVGGAWWILLAVVGAQLVWRSLITGQLLYPAMLVPLVFIGLNAWLAPGEGILLERMSREVNLMPNLWLVLGILLAFLACEHLDQEKTRRTRRLCLPFLVFAFFLAPVLGFVEAIWQWSAGDIGYQWMVSPLILIAMALAARAQRSGMLALVGAGLFYLYCFAGAGDSMAARLELAFGPWRLAAWGFGVALLARGGQWLHGRRPAFLGGPYALPGLRSADANWLYVPAVVVASLAALTHALLPVIRELPAQLWTPYLATATALVTALVWKEPFRLVARVLTVFFFVLGNTHAVRIVLGDVLRSHGLSDLHLICIAISLSLLILTGLRLVVRRDDIVAVFNRVSLVLAGLVLVLLSANYLTHPELAKVTSLRFLVSGFMALLAGLYFRRVARRPGPGEEAFVPVCEALYHFGVVLAIWCAALLIPWMRSPEAALAALAMPAFYFYLCAETGWRRHAESAVRYRNTATVLSFLLLGLYAFRGVLHLVMFPEVDVEVMHYHTSAPIVVLLSLVLFRLHGIGGTEWLAFYGGLALMAGSYFLLTWLPGLSPFTHPVAGAWCAIALGHFWVVASFERSPIRSGIQLLAGIDGSHWFTLRRSWGYCVLGLVHLAVGWGILHFPWHPLAVAPLLAGAASLILHHGIIRRSKVYGWIAFVELFLALHTGFAIDSYLHREHVIWALLVLWFAQWIVVEAIARKRAPDGGIHLKSFGIVMMIAVLAHVLYHHPSSTVGLMAVALSAILGALSRREHREAGTLEEWTGLVALVLAPVWLVYFSQARFLEIGAAASMELWPVLCALGAGLGIAFFARVFQTQQGEAYLRNPRPVARVFHQVLACFARNGDEILRMAMRAGILFLGVVVLLQFDSELPYEQRDLMLGITLWLALAAGWLLEMKRSGGMEPSVLLQASLLGLFLMVRQQLMLATDFWTEEFDVWVSLGASLVLAGTKDLIADHPRGVRLPFLWTLCSMPAVALGLVVVHGLGADIVLVVVGLHSLLFAYLGRGSKDSPYNAIAVLGFVAFVLLAFWTKLELRTLNAYTIPAGLGVLGLVQLFREHMTRETQTVVRSVALIVMLASSAYYAILDPRYPVAFHLTMLLLCIGMMGIGGWLRVRIYLYLGFAGLMVDLCALGYKELVSMDRGVRMTIIGGMVLVIGISLVMGAVYYKTHRQEIAEKLKRWRRRSADWS